MKEINILRFLFVIGVVLYHSEISFSAADNTLLDVSSTNVYNFLVSHNFLFDISLLGLFFLSGYLYTIGKDFDYIGYKCKMDRRVKSLLSPFITWNIIWLVYTFAKNLFLTSKGLPVDVELSTPSQIIQCFWAVNQGVLPNFPIAGYTWFIRDLFIFALVAPAYMWILDNKPLCYLLTFVSIVLVSYKVMLPFFNGALFLGCLLGKKSVSLSKYVEKIPWWLCMLSTIITLCGYYLTNKNPIFYTLMFVSLFASLYKISLILQNYPAIVKFASFSTFLYLSHVLVLNFLRHLLLKTIAPSCDSEITFVYYTSFFAAILICYITFFILQKMNNRILSIMFTGGR